VIETVGVVVVVVVRVVDSVVVVVGSKLEDVARKDTLKLLNVERGSLVVVTTADVTAGVPKSEEEEEVIRK
jgi:hypothetical protein